MRKSKIPKIDYQKFEDGNPFVDNDFTVKVSRLYKKGTFKKDGNGNVLPADYEMEVDVFTKVYKGAEIRDRVSELSPGAKSLYLWIIMVAEPGKDYLWVNREMYMDRNGVASDNTYLKAKDELIKGKFIAQAYSYRDVFWINPRLLFCGSRVNKYGGNVVYRIKKE